MNKGYKFSVFSAFSVVNINYDLKRKARACSHMQPQISLASASPRRRELLDQIGIRYRLLEVSVNEATADNEPPPPA